MNILASELKRTLKKLAPVKAETYQIGEHGISAQDASEVWVVLESPLSELKQTFNFSGKKFSSVINRMSGEIDITVDGNKLVLKSYKAKVELEIRAVSRTTFPSPASKYVSFKSSDLKSALAVASASASPKKGEAYGGAVLLQSLPVPLEVEKPSGYRVVGSDGFVITIVKRNQELPFEFKYQLNLTAAAIVQLMDEDVVEIGETATHLIVKSGADTIYAAKAVLAYPAFDKLIVAQHPVTIQFSPEKWAPALRTVETLIEEEKDSGNISLQFKDGNVAFRTVGVGSTASDEAEYEQLTPDPVFDAKEFAMKVKARYLSGFLAKAGEKATIGVTSSKKPITYESGQIMAITTPSE